MKEDSTSSEPNLCPAREWRGELSVLEDRSKNQDTNLHRRRRSELEAQELESPLLDLRSYFHL